MVASLCGQEIVYVRAILRRTLRDVAVSQSEDTLIHEDNLACIAMFVNPVRRKDSCHIDIRQHYICEVYLDGSVEFVPLYARITWRLTI